MKSIFGPKKEAKKVLSFKMRLIYDKVNAGQALTEEEADLVLKTTDIKGSINWDAVKVISTAGISLAGLYLIAKKEQTDIVNQKSFSIWQKMIGH